MKLNFVENQYIQLAKERFCEVMGAIPFVSDIETIRTGVGWGFGVFHAIIHFEGGREPQRFCVDVKSNGEKRFVSRFMLLASQHKDDSCYVFMAPYISEASSEALIDKKYSYMDLSGNCYILTRQIMIHISGQSNKYVEKREKKNYFSKSSSAASAIMRTILDGSAKWWQVKYLSEFTGKAIGSVSNVKAFLLEREWINDRPHGFQICNIKELLYAWAKDYHKKDSRTFEFYSFDSVAEIERKVARWNLTHDNGALLGGFSAAARYAPTVRYKKAEVYVEPQFYHEFIKDMELQLVDAGGNVVVTIPHDETPCMFYREINGDFVTSPVQTIIDLLGKSGRGEEAAEAIMLKEFEGDQL